MHDYARPLTTGSTVAAEDEELQREFETRLMESSKLAFRVAFSVLRQRQDAEDVAQEAFLKAHRRFRQLRNREAFRSWLVRITWRLALDRRRADQRRTKWEMQHSHEPVLSGTLGSTIASERTAEIWAAIDALPEKLRLAIVLVNVEGHNMKEVGALLGVAEGTIKSRLFDARQRLKERLQWTTNNSTR
jgi:RNA polymerase sigma-70 factor (ECF subfamily)